MEQFIGQQVFAQVVGAQEMYQVTVDLIARSRPMIKQLSTFIWEIILTKIEEQITCIVQ